MHNPIELVRTPDARDGVSRTAIYTLAVLWFVYVIHSLDRTILLILLENIRHEFSLSDSQIGLLSGMGYAIPFGIGCIPLGALADRMSRKTLLIILLVVWCGCTALSGLAGTFMVLLVARAAVGFAESGAPPTMLSILSDRISPLRRPVALSYFYTAPLFGMIGGLLMGGAIAAAWGWRTALYCAALPGLAAALVILLTVPEPGRGVYDAEPVAKARFRDVIARLRQDRRIQLVILALVLVSIVTSGIGSWLPAMLIRSYHFDIRKAAMLTAVASAIAGLLGSLMGGWLSNHYANANPARALRAIGVSMVALAPVGVYFVLSGVAELAILAAALWSFLSGSILGPAFSMLLNWTPSPMRGRMMSLQLLLSYLFGIGLGPQILGLLSDFLGKMGDGRNLPHAFASIVAMALLPGLLLIGSNKIINGESK